MKTPEEIKKGLKCCHVGRCDCEECPYEHTNNCMHYLKHDARALIQQLEAERNSAVLSLHGNCEDCRWEDTAKCASCRYDVDAWNAYDDNWEWRGVKED